MEIQTFSMTPVTPLLRRWWLVVLLGVAAAVVGVLLLVNLSAAVTTLAILVAVGLIVVAVDELAEAERHTVRWPSYVLGTIWLVTAVIALVWPDITLWVLAAMVGIGLIAGGLAELLFVARYRRSLPRWGLHLADGVASVALGVMALAWPKATIMVLAILLGLRILLRGLMMIVFGLGLRSLHRTTQQAHV